MVAFAWLAYALQRGWLAAGPALLDDLPWYGLTFALAEIMARQREHREQVEALAAEIAAANRQLQDYAAQAEELAITRERARLASELHDSVGHTLTALDVQLELLVRLPPGQSEQRQRIAEQARALVKEGLADLRRAVQALRPAALETFSLPEAIAALVTAFEQATHLPTAWQVVGETHPSPSRLALPLYRAAQEALTNVQRHAEARQVWLMLHGDGEAITLQVRDDGRGLPPDAEQFGFGLRGLRERASQLGGELRLESGPGGGTRLVLRLPMTSEQ
jgi:signal transduction histidine kinase